MALAWVRARRRVSSTEAVALTGWSVPYAGTMLTELAEDGVLRPVRSQRTGRGFFCVPVV
jgi:hypothetical protein